nr:MAG TPA: hypothetical protein [Caudoviricetes sp.]
MNTNTLIKLPLIATLKCYPFLLKVCYPSPML